MIRVKQLRESHGLQQKHLALELGVSQPTVCNWESGLKEPSFKSTIKIADYFGVSTDYLLGKTNVPNISESKSAKKGMRIPVLGHIPAGIPIEAIEDIIDYEEIPSSWGKGGQEYFALKLKGDSMTPKYLEDDVVIFLASIDCNSGDDCAVIVNGDEATFKRVRKSESGITIQPLNADKYDSVFYSNEDVETLPLRVIGIAKEIRRKI